MFIAILRTIAILACFSFFIVPVDLLAWNHSNDSGKCWYWKGKKYCKKKTPTPTPTSTPTPDIDCENPIVLDWEDFQGGTTLTNQLSHLGVTISASNRRASHPDKAITFDSSNPTGRDEDLGTPNAQFGGPGLPSGASSNSRPYGQVLIIAENDRDQNNDGLIDNPDDEARGGSIFFEFDSNKVRVVRLDMLDIEESGGRLRGFSDSLGGTESFSLPIPDKGNNSVHSLDLTSVNAVENGALEINLAGSGSVAELVLCGEPIATPTPTPTSTPSPQPSPTPTPTPEPTPSPTPTPTPSPSPSPTPTETPTSTPTPEPTPEPSPTPTTTPEPSPSPSPTPTATPTPNPIPEAECEDDLVADACGVCGGDGTTCIQCTEVDISEFQFTADASVKSAERTLSQRGFRKVRRALQKAGKLSRKAKRAIREKILFANDLQVNAWVCVWQPDSVYTTCDGPELDVCAAISNQEALDCYYTNAEELRTFAEQELNGFIRKGFQRASRANGTSSKKAKKRAKKVTERILKQVLAFIDEGLENADQLPQESLQCDLG